MEQRFLCDEGEKRLDVWLSEKMNGFSRTYVKRLIDDGLVRIHGKSVKSNYRTKQNDEVWVEIPEPKKLEVTPEKIELHVVYEDDDIIVVEKPKGMVVHPAAGNFSGTLVNALMDYCGETLSDINGVIRPGIVHRIDKDTSGILVVAKNNHAHENLSEQFKVHSIKRVYYAIVDGILREDNARVEAPVGRHPVDRKKMSVNVKNGRNAITHFKVLERFKDKTFIELKLETGRTHQIRVHMAYIGHPVMGDEVYGKRSKKYETGGQVLHAKVLGIKHPTRKEYMEFESVLPEYFEGLLKELRNDQ